MSDRFVVLVVDDDSDDASTLARDLEDLLEGTAAVDVVQDAVAARRHTTAVETRGGVIPVAFVDVDVGDDPSQSTSLTADAVRVALK